MAGNPFRPPNPVRASEGLSLRETTPPPSKSQTSKKKVTIQTPPGSPEDVPRRLSAGNISPPPPPQSPDEDSDSSSTATADGELEEALKNTRRNSGSLPPPPSAGTSTIKAPYNPFARTLATREAGYEPDGADEPRRETVQQDGSVRVPLDVDQFKNILLTGSATPPSTASTQWQKGQDNSSSADASSVSRQSLFDPAYEIHPETPRTSIEQLEFPESSSDSDDTNDDEDSTLMSVDARLDDLAPPAPPKSTHGKPLASKAPQNVSFSDFEESIRPTPAPSAASKSPVARTLSDQKRPTTLQRSGSDLNKPLPAPPPKSPVPHGMLMSSSEVDSSSQQNKSTLIAPQIPAESRKAPPPPPAARRTGLERNRSDSHDRDQASAHVDESARPPNSTDTSTKSAAPPPPPASRKSRPISQNATSLTETPPKSQSPALELTEAKSMRPPPPPRVSSKAGSSIHRSPSSASHSSVSRSETPSSSLTAPPAPPPRRSGLHSNRTSVDGRPPSLDERRRSSEYSLNAEKSTSLPQFPNVAEMEENQRNLPVSSEPPVERDVLADMTAFQAEIDALRARAGNTG